MGLIGGTLLFHVVCFCARVALDDMGQTHLIRKKNHRYKEASGAYIPCNDNNI